MLQALLKKYNHMKLQSKLTLSLVLIVFIPALSVGFLFYNRLYDMVISDTIRAEQDSASTTVPIIDDALLQIKELSSGLSDYAIYKELFFSPVSEEFSDLFSSKDMTSFENSISRLINETPLTSVQFYIDVSKSELPEGLSDYFHNFYSIQTYWRGIFHSDISLKELFCPSQYLGPEEMKRNGDQAYIRRTTMYYKEEAVEVFIACYYNSELLTNILREHLNLEQSVSYLINDRNCVVASSNESLAGTYMLDYDSVDSSFMSSNNFLIRTILDTEVYAGYYSINLPRWYMVTILPKKPMVFQGNMIILQILAIYIVILILAVFLANMFSRSITNRISSVIGKMRNVRYGPPVPMESSPIHDEVGDLIDTYNYMTAKMNKLMEEQAKAAEDLRRSEFKSLQAQINPHFLYNTMDMINWLAQQGQTDEVSNAVQSLSHFYKLTLNSDNISTISREEEHVILYTKIQNMRYCGKIEFITDIPDELHDYTIPKLTLQPVVENAILHGILESESKSGNIVLTGWKEDNDIILLISDNGVGMTEDQLKNILTGKVKSKSNGSNIAISNTHKRLEILYGKGYGLSYSSTEGQGTEVEIRIPAIRKQ